MDDEEAILRWLVAILDEHDVTTTTDPLASIEQFASGSFEVFFCDLMMPNVTGLDVHHALQPACPTEPTASCS